VPYPKVAQARVTALDIAEPPEHLHHTLPPSPLLLARLCRRRPPARPCLGAANGPPSPLGGEHHPRATITGWKRTPPMSPVEGDHCPRATVNAGRMHAAERPATAGPPATCMAIIRPVGPLPPALFLKWLSSSPAQVHTPPLSLTVEPLLWLWIWITVGMEWLKFKWMFKWKD
jgi:hypothetical protein